VCSSACSCAVANGNKILKSAQLQWVSKHLRIALTSSSGAAAAGSWHKLLLLLLLLLLLPCCS
jgi:hypothetical protein